MTVCDVTNLPYMVILWRHWLPTIRVRILMQHFLVIIEYIYHIEYSTPRTVTIKKACRSHVTLPDLMYQMSSNVENWRKCFAMHVRCEIIISFTSYLVETPRVFGTCCLLPVKELTIFNPERMTDEKTPHRPPQRASK